SQFVENYKAALTNLRRGRIRNFKFKYLTKKSPSQWVGIRKQSLRWLKLCPTFLGRANSELRMKSGDKRWYLRNAVNVKGYPTSDFKIHCVGGEYYLNISVKRKPTCNVPDDTIVALDPGERTFQTFYSSDGTHGKLGNGFSEKRLQRLRNQIARKERFPAA